MIFEPSEVMSTRTWVLGATSYWKKKKCDAD